MPSDRLARRVFMYDMDALLEGSFLQSLANALTSASTLPGLGMVRRDSDRFFRFRSDHSVLWRLTGLEEVTQCLACVGRLGAGGGCTSLSARIKDLSPTQPLIRLPGQFGEEYTEY